MTSLAGGCLALRMLILALAFVEILTFAYGHLSITKWLYQTFSSDSPGPFGRSLWHNGHLRALAVAGLHVRLFVCCS